MTSKFQRSQNKVLGGVCGMIAERTGWDVGIVRIGVAVLGFVTSGAVVAAYLAAWLILPQEGADRTVLDELVGKGKQTYSEAKAKHDAKEQDKQPVFDPYNDK